MFSDSNDNKPTVRLDDLDMKILVLFILALNTKDISREARVPPSSIQMRTRRIFKRS
jgi:hypothetical protein